MIVPRPLGTDWFLCDPAALDAYLDADAEVPPGEPGELAPRQLDLFEAGAGGGASATCPSPPRPSSRASPRRG